MAEHLALVKIVVISQGQVSAQVPGFLLAVWLMLQACSRAWFQWCVVRSYLYLAGA
jgi:hypothetical protein